MFVKNFWRNFDGNGCEIICKQYSRFILIMKKIYFFITIALVLFIFNLTKIDFENLFGEDSKIGLIGALACACTILLLTILYVSKKINNKQG